MTGIQITLEELCSSCSHNGWHCDSLFLYDKIDYADGSYYCENHLPKNDSEEAGQDES